ncbi:hydroxyacid dehydrogenase [bacterium]|nr:MAG: hydroxyacid dehydrogenase [bacterium]
MTTVLWTTSSFGAAATLERAGLAVRPNPMKRKLTEDEALALFAEARPAGLVAGLEPLTRRVLEASRAHLKVVSRCGTGLDNVDLPAARELGIRVFNTPDAPAPAVAELALALMLAALRRVAEGDRGLRAGRWERLPGGLLGARTVGVVGYGRVGRRVAALCRAFGSTVLAHDPVPFSDAAVRAVGLEELLAEADVVTLHAAGSGRLLDAPRLARMKKGAVLVNTARGGLVDEEALAAALRSGALSGAGLDVFESEPYAGPLKDLPNAVLTPHIGSAAAECRGRMELEAAENLVRGLKEAGIL